MTQNETNPRCSEVGECLKLGISITRELKDCFDQQPFKTFTLSANLNAHGWRFVEWLGLIPGMSQYCDADMIYSPKVSEPNNVAKSNEVYSSFDGDKISFDAKGKKLLRDDGSESLQRYNENQDDVLNNEIEESGNSKSILHVRTMPVEKGLVLCTTTTNDLRRLAILITNVESLPYDDLENVVACCCVTLCKWACRGNDEKTRRSLMDDLSTSLSSFIKDSSNRIKNSDSTNNENTITTTTPSTRIGTNQNY